MLVQLERDGRRLSPRTVAGLAVSAVVAVGAASPYWSAVISNHGVAVFFSAFAAQHEGRLLPMLRAVLDSSIFHLGASAAPSTPTPFLWSAMVFCGVVWALLNRHVALVPWFIILAIVPREGSWLVALPGSLLAGIGAAELFWPTLITLIGRRVRGSRQGVVTVAFALLFAVPVVFTPFADSREMVRGNDIGTQPSADAIAGMEWLEKNTPPESRLIVLSSDQVTEWVPQISRRTVLNVRFGTEWEPEKRARLREFNDRLWRCRDLYCVQDSVRELTGYDDVYLYLERNRLSSLLSPPGRQEVPPAAFLLVWQNGSMAVARLAPPQGFAIRVSTGREPTRLR